MHIIDSCSPSLCFPPSPISTSTSETQNLQSIISKWTGWVMSVAKVIFQISPASRKWSAFVPLTVKVDVLHCNKQGASCFSIICPGNKNTSTDCFLYLAFDPFCNPVLTAKHTVCVMCKTHWQWEHAVFVTASATVVQAVLDIRWNNSQLGFHLGSSYCYCSINQSFDLLCKWSVQSTESKCKCEYQ